MDGIIGGFEIGLMAGHTLCGSVRIALRMANVAGNVIVTAGQGKAGKIMIELRRTPAHDRMADGAVCPEIAADMIRVVRGLVVALMARVALGAGLTVNRARLMAGAAVINTVAALERKAGRMLECRQIAHPGGY